jgi:hypothetical protein
VADGNTTNLAEYQRFAGQFPRSVPQLIALLNDLRGNTKAYVRVWRAEAGYYVQGEDLPAPPPSVSMILLRTPSFLGGTVGARSSKVAELEIPFEDAAVYGSKTLQVEVKE